MQPTHTAKSRGAAAVRARGTRLFAVACGCMSVAMGGAAAAADPPDPTLPAGPSPLEPRSAAPAPVPAPAPGARVGVPAALADEFPKRRSGLWEVDTVGAQAAGLPAAQYCVDETTDRATLHLDRSFGTKGACRFGAFQRAGDGWVSETVCREGRSVITTRSVATGDFHAAYRIDTLITYEPPLGGFRREERTATVGRRLGACLPGQVAGDVAIPGMGRINMQNGNVVADEPDPKARKRRAPKQHADG